MPTYSSVNSICCIFAEKMSNCLFTEVGIPLCSEGFYRTLNLLESVSRWFIAVVVILFVKLLTGN